MARTNHLGARSLAVLAAGRVLQCESCVLRVWQRCAKCGGPHGQPFIEHRQSDVTISASHSGDYVAAAAGPPTASVGIDIEHERDRRHIERVSRTVFSSGELAAASLEADSSAALLRTWTKKEAVIKAVGGDINMMATIDTSCGSNGEIKTAEHGTFRFMDIAVGSVVGTVVALADHEIEFEEIDLPMRSLRYAV